MGAEVSLPEEATLALHPRGAVRQLCVDVGTVPALGLRPSHVAETCLLGSGEERVSF